MIDTSYLVSKSDVERMRAERDALAAENQQLKKHIEEIPAIELRMVLDQLALWRDKYGVKYVTMTIDEDDDGMAWDFDDDTTKYIVCKHYGEKKNSQAAATTRKSR